MKENYVVAIGVACIDEYYETDHWIPEGEKCNIRWRENRVGGMIPNAACVLAGLGEKTYLVTALNSSSVSEVIKKNLENCKLDLSYMITDDSLSDPKCIIVSTPAERSIFVVDTSNIRYKVDKALYDLLINARCIYTSIMEFHRLQNWETLARELTEAGVALIFDVETSTFDRWDDPLFSYEDLLFFNEEGWKKFKNGRSDAETAQGLLEGNVKTFAVTLGEKGCYCRNRESEIRLPGNKVNVIDPTGAGDTFNCSFTACWLRGESLEYAAEYANAAAAHAVTVVGARAGIATKEETEQRMREFRKEKEALEK